MSGGLWWEHRSDSELVDQALNAESQAERESAYSAIFARHHRGVLAFCGGTLQDPHRAADAAAQTFTEAFTGLANLNEPDKLRAWLFGIARNQCHTERTRHRRQALVPELGAGSEDELVSYERASRARQAEVDRLLDAVVATFTGQQQKVFQLSVRQGLVGGHLAKALAVKPEEASRRTNEIITMAYQGFGALVLAREGRRYCPVLAGILDQYAWNGENFTKKLRLRIIRHLNNCLRCDNCATCGTQRDHFLRPLAPALIPILVIPIVRHRAEASGRKQAQRHSGGKKRAATAGTGTAVALAVALRVLLMSHHHVPPTEQQATISVWVEPGSGWTVTSSPAGLSCADICRQTFTGGSQVNLTSNYQPGSIPLNWVGCDNATSSAADTCVLTLYADKAVCIAPYDPPITVMTPADCASRTGG